MLEQDVDWRQSVNQISLEQVVVRRCKQKTRWKSAQGLEISVGVNFWKMRQHQLYSKKDIIF